MKIMNHIPLATRYEQTVHRECRLIQCQTFSTDCHASTEAALLSMDPFQLQASRAAGRSEECVSPIHMGFRSLTKQKVRFLNGRYRPDEAASRIAIIWSKGFPGRDFSTLR
jgi:hypothetical protein